MKRRREIIALIMAINLTMLNSNIIYGAPNIELNKIEKDAGISNFKNLNESNKEKLIENCKSVFETKNIIYPYDDIYISKKDIENILKNTSNHKKFETKNSLSAKDIVANIATNSNKYFNNDEHLSIFKTDDSFSVQVVLNKIVEDIINSETNDIDEDLYLISNLRIGIYSDKYDNNPYYFDNSNTYYTVLMVNKNAIFKNNEEVGSSEYYVALTNSLARAISDLRQFGVNDNINLFNYLDGYKSVIVDDASKRYPKLYNKYDYKDDYLYLDDADPVSLLLLGVLNSNAKPKEYYNAMFNQDAKKVFDLFELNTSDDIYNFYKILFAMDAKTYNNDFFQLYSFTDESRKYPMGASIGYSYKLTLYNMYVNKILNYMESNELSLEENLTLYYLGFNLIGSNIDLENVGYNTIFTIDTIKKEHDKYINFIKDYYKVDDNTIDDITNGKVVLNIVSMEQEIPGIETIDVSSYLEKFPMLEVFKTTVIPLEGHKRILESNNYLAIKGI